MIEHIILGYYSPPIQRITEHLIRGQIASVGVFCIGVEVDMRVNQTRDHRSALQVDHLSPRTGKWQHCLVRANGGNLISCDGNGLGDGKILIHR